MSGILSWTTRVTRNFGHTLSLKERKTQEFPILYQVTELFSARRIRQTFLTKHTRKLFPNPVTHPTHLQLFQIPPIFLDKITVSKKGVLTLLQNIKENKATGPDEIPGKFLKICAFELHEIFTILFQTSLTH